MKTKFRLPFLFLVPFLLIGCGGGPSTKPPASEDAPTAPPKTLQNISSWCLYYGAATTDIVARLAPYDLVVIDPQALGPNAAAVIADLKSRGRLVVGYLSMTEVARWHRYRTRVPDNWLVRVDGKLWNPWGHTDVGWNDNVVASLAEPGWRNLLVELVRTEVLDYGCDGVFMDTLEDLDFHSLPEEERARQLDGARLLLAAFDETYPDALFIANRALEKALEATAPHLDGLCWESFDPKYFADPQVKTWMEGIAAHVAEQQKRAKPPFAVISLCDFPKDTPDFDKVSAEMAKISAEYHYVPYCTLGGYSSLPPRP